MKKFIGIVGIGLICCLVFVILWRGKNPERNGEDFTPIKEENVVGELYVPEGYVYNGGESFIEQYVFEYNGYETTDKIVYDKEDGKYIIRRNVIDKSRLTEINFTEVKKNSNAFNTNYSDKHYEDYFDVITMVENTPTVVRVCSYIDANGCLDYDCIDLQNNQDITEKVDLWEDIM